MTRRVSGEWFRAHKAFLERASVNLASQEYSENLPEHLFHFTDCQGLIGILRSRSLRASLATSLNDRSEIEYGKTLVTDLVGDKTGSPKVRVGTEIS